MLNDRTLRQAGAESEEQRRRPWQMYQDDRAQTAASQRNVLAMWSRNNQHIILVSSVLQSRTNTETTGGGSARSNLQVPGTRHQFPCGCVGILPDAGKNNKFAKSTGKSFQCRVSAILNQSRAAAACGGHTAIDINTPHTVIRKLMDATVCWRCEQPLDWENLGRGTTPHIHHNNASGQLYGATHHACNPHAEAEAHDRLYIKVQILEQRVRELRIRSRSVKFSR